MKNSLVLGFFDGIHIAHRAVINSAFKYSDNVTVITFKKSPSAYFNKTEEYIFSRKNSAEKILSLGVNKVEELNFEKIANIKAEDYISGLVEKYNPVSISTGFNHTFGCNKEGNSKLLGQLSKKYGFIYECVEPVIHNGEIISSTLIKEYLKKGKIDYANSLLESEFTLEGIVVHGAKIGRKIGFPTANISYPKNIVKIPFGVYCVKYGQHKAVLNWGMKPTVNNTVEPVVEVNILDFNDDLYGKNIQVKILKQIRNEKKFNNLEELKSQIQRDINICLEL